MAYIDENDATRERMRALLDRLTDEQLAAPVNDDWTVAGVLTHVAFWDARAGVLAGKLARGEPFTPSDEEPDDVAWINDGMRPLLHAIEPRRAAELAVTIAEETDGLIASLPANRMYPADEHAPLNAFRSVHRVEHLDEIDSLFG